MQLNPRQDAARRYVDGPLLVLAGAGSGKTGVITRKVAYLVQELGYLPEKIAAITFTNKAAREMRQRVGRLLRGTDLRGLNVCTFHALGLRILRQECEQLGWQPGFSIFDAQDSLAVVRDLLPAGSAPDQVARHAALISRLKAASLDCEAAESEAASTGESALAEIYRAYQDRLRHLNAFDFDDLILMPLKLLAGNKPVRERWRQRLRYLLVDEVQDTNTGQFELLRQLVGRRGALTAVGDDDQSIYGWRGAQPENLDRLAATYPGLRVIKLEQNYRSTRTILAAANHVVAHNPHSMPKRLWSDLGDGDPIRVLPCEDAQREAETVVGALIQQRFALKAAAGDFAILYRSNHQARLFEQALRAHRIPYRISGGPSFFDRAEIRDLLAYLRLLANPRDDGAFLRAVNTPRREIGAGSVDRIAAFAGRHGTSLLAALRQADCRRALGSRAARRGGDFVAWIDGLRASRDDPWRTAQRIVEDTRYLDFLRQQSRDALEADRRIRAVDDLLDWIRRLQEGPDAVSDLTGLIQQLALAGTDDEDDGDDRVRLMTLHASKGLEFPHVYLVGVEEDILPHRNSVEEDTIAEERRLMYVGMTRARRSLTLTYARQRKRFGETLRCRPSRFLDELPADGVQWRGRDGQADKERSRETARTHLAGLKAMLGD